MGCFDVTVLEKGVPRDCHLRVHPRVRLLYLTDSRGHRCGYGASSQYDA